MLVIAPIFQEVPTKLEVHISVQCQVKLCCLVVRVGPKIIWVGDNSEGSRPFKIEISTHFQNDLVGVIVVGGNDSKNGSTLF